MNEKQLHIVVGVFVYALFIVCLDVYFMHFEGFNKSINQDIYSHKLKSQTETKSHSRYNPLEKEISLNNKDKIIPSVDDEFLNENAPAKIITVNPKKNTQSKSTNLNSKSNLDNNTYNSIYIKIGVFSDLKNIRHNITYLKEQGLKAIYQRKIKPNGKKLYELKIIKIKSYSQALKVKKIIDQKLKVNSKIIEP